MNFDTGFLYWKCQELLIDDIYLNVVLLLSTIIWDDINNFYCV